MYGSPFVNEYDIDRPDETIPPYTQPIPQVSGFGAVAPPPIVYQPPQQQRQPQQHSILNADTGKGLRGWGQTLKGAYDYFGGGGGGESALSSGFSAFDSPSYVSPYSGVSAAPEIASYGTELGSGLSSVGTAATSGASAVSSGASAVSGGATAASGAATGLSGVGTAGLGVAAKAVATPVIGKYGQVVGEQFAEAGYPETGRVLAGLADYDNMTSSVLSGRGLLGGGKDGAPGALDAIDAFTPVRLRSQEHPIGRELRSLSLGIAPSPQTIMSLFGSSPA